MRVSHVEVIPISPKNGLIGFASIELDGQVVLNSIGIHSRRDGKGYRLTYPTRQRGWQDFVIFHPVTPEFSKTIETIIFEKVEQVFGQ